MNGSGQRNYLCGKISVICRHAIIRLFAELRLNNIQGRQGIRRMPAKGFGVECINKNKAGGFAVYQSVIAGLNGLKWCDAAQFYIFNIFSSYIVPGLIFKSKLPFAFDKK